jgi:decaheme cytochrome c component MtrC/MtrF-like protein
MFIVRVLLVLAALSSQAGAAAQFSEPVLHLDRRKLPYGCGSCHSGLGFKSGGGTAGCLKCHTSTMNPEKGLVTAGVELKDVGLEFRKLYRHPSLDVSNVHRRGEELPETNPRAPRHADCVDCHNPHYLTASNKFAGIKGKRLGSAVLDVNKEYELCYKCHGDSANMPGRSTNKRVEFSVNNPSYHPVEGEGKNTLVVSLLKPYKAKKVNPEDVSVLGCNSCHGSESPDAPRGPHGSNYRYILTENYSTGDGEPESVFAYALCYRCHSRASILNDESFRFHSRHIRGIGGISSGLGTSCYTCHSSHGSAEYKYLIRFNKDVVTANSSGLLKFVEKGAASFRGECYLSCHGVDHNPKSY